jgi:ketosteroid isomerase-like protein
VPEDLDRMLELYHAAGGSFVNWRSRTGRRRSFSHSSDACLVNPMGVVARGWPAVPATTKEAAAQFSEGEITLELFHRVEMHDVAYITEVKSWRADSWETGERAAGALRVASILRRETAGWKVLHRHADPFPCRPPPSGTH